MGLFPKKNNQPSRESARHAGSEGKEEAKEPRSAPGNYAHLKSVKAKLKDAIDSARLCSDSGSGGDDSDDEVPIASQLQQKKEDVRHEANLGDRNVVPRREFFSTGRLDVPMLGVVSKGSTRGHARTWFEGDERATQHKGRLEEWDLHFVNAAEGERRWKVSAMDDERLIKLETLAGIRAKPKPLAAKTIVAEKKKSARKEVAKEVEDAPTEVGTWDSDAEDDEHEDEPLVDDDDEHDDCPSDETLEQPMGKLKWKDVGRALTDQRAASGSMPESITPALLANFRGESWLGWFLHWVPLKTLAAIVEATGTGANKAAIDVKWSSFKTSLPWKKLTTGEFLRWLGLHIYLLRCHPPSGPATSSRI
jgi:hypothetical protein